MTKEIRGAGVNAPQNDPFGVEKIHQNGHGVAQAAAALLPDRQGGLVGRVGVGGIRQRKGGDTVQLLLGGAEGRGFPLLQGAESKALTQLAQSSARAKALHRADLVVAHGTVGIQADMTDLTGVVVGARVELAVQDESRSKARAKGAKNHILGAPPRAESPFR